MLQQMRNQTERIGRTERRRSTISCIRVANMIGPIASGTTDSLVAKKGTEKLSQLFLDGFLCSRCLNDHIKVPNMMKLFAGGATF